jgi:hypothetical protein
MGQLRLLAHAVIPNTGDVEGLHAALHQAIQGMDRPPRSQCH